MCSFWVIHFCFVLWKVVGSQSNRGIFTQVDSSAACRHLTHSPFVAMFRSSRCPLIDISQAGKCPEKEISVSFPISQDSSLSFFPANKLLVRGWSWTCDFLLRNFGHFPCLAAIFVLVAKVRICLWENLFPEPTQTYTVKEEEGCKWTLSGILPLLCLFCNNFLTTLRLAGGTKMLTPTWLCRFFWWLKPFTVSP